MAERINTKPVDQAKMAAVATDGSVCLWSVVKEKGATLQGNIWKLLLVIPKGMKNYTV